MLSSDSPVMTIILCIITLVLGLPVATAAIVFESAWVPSIILGTKIIDTGPGQTTTLRFDLLSGPNDAVSAGAYISIISAIIVIIGFVLSRHITYHNVYGWLILGPSLLNFFSQIGSCAASYIFRNKYPEATSNTDVRFIDGAYNTDGRLFTKESWACTMNTFYREREGKWADKACSNFGVGRVLTIPLVVCAAMLLVVSYWQIHQCGGIGWLIGHRDRNTPSYKPKEEYIDLR